MPEYELLMEAVKLKRVDQDYRNHLQAFLNFAVKAEKKISKTESRPVFKEFKKFFDYEKELGKITMKKRPSRFSGLGKFFKKGE